MIAPPSGEMCRSSIVTSSVTEKQSCTSIRSSSLARLVDAGLLVGALGGDARGGEIAAVPGVVLRLQAVRHRDLQRLDGDHILLAEAPGDLRRGDDGAGRAVAHAAAVVEAERLGHHRRIEHGVHR